MIFGGGERRMKHNEGAITCGKQDSGSLRGIDGKRLVK